VEHSKCREHSSLLVRMFKGKQQYSNGTLCLLVSRPIWLGTNMVYDRRNHSCRRKLLPCNKTEGNGQSQSANACKMNMIMIGFHPLDL
jgi:hypothetical protein